MVSFEEFREVVRKKCIIDCKIARLQWDLDKTETSMNKYLSCQNEYVRIHNSNSEMCASIFAYYFLQNLTDSRDEIGKWIALPYANKVSDVFKDAENNAEKQLVSILKSQYDYLNPDWQNDEKDMNSFKVKFGKIKKSSQFDEFRKKEVEYLIDAKTKKLEEMAELYYKLISAPLEEKINIMYPYILEDVQKKEKQYRINKMDYELVHKHGKVHGNVLSSCEDVKQSILSLSEEQYKYLLLSLKDDDDYLAICKKIAFREKMDNFMDISTGLACAIGVASVVGGGLHSCAQLLQTGHNEEYLLTMACALSVAGGIFYVAGDSFKKVHQKNMKKARINDGVPLEEQVALKIASHIQNLSKFEEDMAKNTYNKMRGVNHYSENLFIDILDVEEK